MLNWRINEIERYRNIREISEDSFRLDMAERQNLFPSEFVDKFHKSFNQLDLLCYPLDFYENELTELIKTHIGGKNIEVSIGAGSDHLIKDAIHVFCASENKKLLIPTPSFPMYKIYARCFGVDTIEIEHNSILTDFDSLIENINNKIGLVILANPTSPFGEYCSPSDIKKVSQKCHDVGAILMIDEAYIDFVDEPHHLIEFNLRNTIFLRTFSKAYGFAGGRIGFIYGEGKYISLIKNINLTYPVSNYSLKFAIFLLKNSHIVDHYSMLVRKERDILYKELEKNNVFFYKTQSNSIHILGNDYFDKKFNAFEMKYDVLVKTSKTASTPIVIPSHPGTNWYRIAIIPNLVNYLNL